MNKKKKKKKGEVSQGKILQCNTGQVISITYIIETNNSCLACHNRCCGFQGGFEFDSSLRLTKPLHKNAVSQQRGRGCPSRVPRSAAQSPPRPAVALDPWPFHSPPPPRKCSAVASPSVPSPSLPWAPRARPVLSASSGNRRAETPARY